MQDTTAKSAEPREGKGQGPVVIKKYANRRLYNTETSTYVTLDDLAIMVRGNRDFVVYDAKSGEDLTHAVLTQIIVEQESRMGGETMLPIPFLQQLIRFYGGNMQKMVPSYLQFSLANLAKEQERIAKQFGTALTPAGAFEAIQDQTRKNMAMFEQAMANAMTMFTPFKGDAPPTAASPRPEPSTTAPLRTKPEVVRSEMKAEPARDDDLADLKAQMAAMQNMIEKLSRQQK